MTRPRRTFAPFLLVLALLVGACGGTALDARSAFLAGIDAVAEESSARVLFATTTTLPDGSDVVAEGEGVQAMDGSASELTISTSFGGQSFAMTTRVLGTTVYLSGGPFDQLLGPGTWVELTLDDIEASTGLDLSQVMQSAQQAKSSIEQLRGITEDSFEVVGDEEIDGIATTHYRGTVDTETALAGMDADDADALAEVMDMLPETFDVDVWMDGENRPVQVVTDTEVTVEGQTLRSSTTIGFRDWGVDVDVQAPEDAVGFAEVMDRIGGFGG